MELNILAVTGTRPDARAQRAFEAVAASATVADPRILPLNIVRLVSAYGGALATMASAFAWQGNANVGASVARPAAALLMDWNRRFRDLDDDAVVDVLKAKSKQGPLPGFGVPFRKVDERLEALLHRLQIMEFTGEYVQLVRRIRRLAPKVGLKPNLALATAAVILDLGYSVDDAAVLGMLVLQAAYLANAVEGARQAPEVLQCLPDACIEYVGPKLRKSPRAEVGEEGR